MQLTTSLGAVFDLVELGHGHWQAHIDSSWRGWSGPHGGVIAALTVEVARRTVGEQFPVRACDLRFLGRPRDGELTLRTEHHPVGRTSHVVDVRVLQHGQTVAGATITLGRRGDTAVPARRGRRAPEVPGAEECARFHLPGDIVAAGAHFDIRPAAGPLPLTGSDQAWMAAWIALSPTTGTALPIDAATLSALADALPPGIFPTLSSPVAVPTVTLSMHLHTDEFDADARFALVRTANASTGDGWSVDESDIWDEHGLLLATARQSRRVLG